MGFDDRWYDLFLFSEFLYYFGNYDPQ
jgi:hypothetical protein